MNFRFYLFLVPLLTLPSWLGNFNSVVGQPIALVDVRAIFQQHEAFNQQLEQLRQQAEQFQTESQQVEQRLMQMSEALRQYSPSSPEFRQGESELAQQAAAFEVSQRNKMSRLMQQEAQLHYETYRQIQAAVAEHCHPRGIELVLRFRADEMDPQNNESVINGVNAPIIYFRPSLDITPTIVSMLRTRSAAGQANPGSTGTVPR